MKILPANIIRELDSFTIQSEQIDSIDLMERASKAFVSKFVSLYPSKHPVRIICGLGNNGGDGLAIARLLSEQSYDVHVFIIRYEGKPSQNFSTNLERLNTTLYTTVSKIEELKIEKGSVVIDALFGSGLNKPLNKLCSQVISFINEQQMEVIAVDISSGLYTDLPTPSNQAFKVKRTFTFQLPKLAFMFPENDAFVGKWEILDIGLSPEFIEAQKSTYHFTQAHNAALILKERAKFAHKGTFGHALLISGSIGKMGAAILATQSCLRSGVGLLTVHIPQSGRSIIQVTCPEAMVSLDDTDTVFSEFNTDTEFAAIGIGPGLGTDPKTAVGVEELLKQLNNPVVLDADALNIIAEKPELLKHVPANSILTPHLKEFDRLIGRKALNHFERLDLLKDFASNNNVIVILKGAHTAVADINGKIFFNESGNPGMAKGGSGDVLTGILLALLAQKYDSAEAAKLGVFLHGLAGDIAAKKRGEESMLPSDLIESLGKAFKKLHKAKDV